MNKLYIIIFIALISSINVIAQNKESFAASLDGYYSGFYISKKKLDKKNTKLHLKVEKNKGTVSESVFGTFTITIKDNGSDTLHFISSNPNMKVKYIKSSKRISFIDTVGGQIVNFTGKYSYKDADDLDKRIATNETLLASKKDVEKFYGKFYGTIKSIEGNIKVDTITVTQIEKRHEDANLIIIDRYAGFSSAIGSFKYFETQIKISNSGQLIVAHNNPGLKLNLNYENQTLYLLQTSSGMEFQGIEIEGISK